MHKDGLVLGLFGGLLGLFCMASSSFGAGFALYEGGARATAMGGALVGKADDPSAVWYNPAGITQLPGTQVMAGMTVILPKTDVTTTDPTTGRETKTPMEEDAWLPPHFYVTHQLSDQFWLGFGVFSPFGLGTEFDAEWAGRFNSYKALIKTVNFNPNIAWKINDQLSIAAGLDVMWFDLELRNKIPVFFGTTFLGEVDQKLTGDSFGWGGNLALHYRPCQYAALGVSYRSRVEQNVSGEAEFHRDRLVPSFLFNNTDARGSIMLPDEVYVGLAVFPMPKLSLEVGTVWTNWSTYDKLRIDYADPLVPGVDSAEREKHWEDAWRIFFGAEYKVNEMLDLRFGYVFDQEPSPDEYVDFLVPANDRHLFSFGPGIHWCGWDFDLSYTYLWVMDRTMSNESIGDSKFEGGNAHLIGLSASYKF
jgi:long-chain fatty acid transport protein